jgi:hypothetical protein
VEPMADHGDAERQAHWLVPSYLAAHGCPNATLASYDDLGLTSVIETSTRCSDFRGHARHLALPMPPMALSDNPWREVFGLAGSIGESLAIAAACEVEVDLHRKARACGDLPPEMIVGQRFFSIAEGHEVLGIGHRLANLVLRGVAIGEGMRDGISAQGKLFQAWAKSHKPFSDARAAWVSFNRSTVDCLTRVVASSPHPALRDLAGALAALHQSAVWMAIDDSRGQDFHRWRAESSVLAGVDQQSGYFREICGSTRLSRESGF